MGFLRMEKSAAQRSTALDTLRGIAVLLVLFRHMPLPEVSFAMDPPPIPDSVPDWLYFILITLKTGGWAGVDLFFVLSGFLVSGLLFREWQLNGKFRVGRFLIRRAFKIYPAYYVMLAATIGYAYSQGRWPGWDRVLVEAVFVQNYWVGIFPHTWSLAVEEHFYLALPLVLILCTGTREKPFRLLPHIIIVIAVACLALRLYGTIHGPKVTRDAYVPTHLRCDSLFFGVFLSWLYHFHRPRWDWVAAKAGPFLPLVAIAGFAPTFIWEVEKTRALTTWGFTGLYIGSGALLMWILKRDFSFRPLAFIGFYSYSIYLWHISLSRFVAPMIHGVTPDAMIAIAVYFPLTIGVGILLAWLIEIPALRLRERLT